LRWCNGKKSTKMILNNSNAKCTGNFYFENRYTRNEWWRVTLMRKNYLLWRARTLQLGFPNHQKTKHNIASGTAAVPTLILQQLYEGLPDHLKFFKDISPFRDYWNFTSFLLWILFRYSGAAHIVATQLFLNSFFLTKQLCSRWNKSTRYSVH